MAQTLLEADAALTLVADWVDPELAREAEVLRVPAARRLPALPDRLLWSRLAGRRVAAGGRGIVHVHLASLLGCGDLMTCHHLSRSGRERGVRETGDQLVRVAREWQARAALALDDHAYRTRSASTRITFNSDLLRDEFRLHYGEPCDGTVLFPPAPPFQPPSAWERAEARAMFGVSSDGFVVGYLGGNDLRKGLRDVEHLAADGRCEVLIAGPGLERYTAPSGRSVGYVDPERLLAAVDVLAAPSLFEAVGLVVGESLARGTPVVVAPHCGWASSVRRHRAGVVWDRRVPLFEAAQIARSALPDACRAAVEEVSRRHQSDALLALYGRVTDSRAPVSREGGESGGGSGSANP
jgi:glycosyltransferase involved in cell wall biosynthesis